MPEEPDKKKRLWHVDPAMFDSSRRAGFIERRVIPPLRQVGKFVLIALALTYPVYLVIVGLEFGGLAFWAFLAGSFTVIGVVISRLGFASNFRNWDIGMRRMSAVFLGGLVAVGFYAGLLYLRTWFVPFMLLPLAVGLYVILRRSRS